MTNSQNKQHETTAGYINALKYQNNFIDSNEMEN